MKKSTIILILGLISIASLYAYQRQQQRTERLYESRRVNLVHLRDSEFNKLGFDKKYLIKSKYVLFANCNSIRSKRVYAYPKGTEMMAVCQSINENAKPIGYSTLKHPCYSIKPKEHIDKKAPEIRLKGYWRGGLLVKSYQGKKIGEFATIPFSMEYEKYLADDYQEKRLSVGFTVIDKKNKPYHSTRTHGYLSWDEQESPRFQQHLMVLAEWQIMLDGKAYRKNRGTNEHNDCRVYDVVKEPSVPESSL